MGFLDKLFGQAKVEEVEAEVELDATVEMADEAAAPRETSDMCTCTDEKQCDHCAAKGSVDMDADNLD